MTNPPELNAVGEKLWDAVVDYGTARAMLSASQVQGDKTSTIMYEDQLRVDRRRVLAILAFHFPAEPPKVKRGEPMPYVNVDDEGRPYDAEAPKVKDPYEYCTTTGPRKAWDGEPDLTKEGWEKLDWNRYDYHEEQNWRRLKQKPEAPTP